MRYSTDTDNESVVTKELKEAKYVLAAAFAGYIRQIRRRKGANIVAAAIFRVSLADIEKALAPKREKIIAELRAKIPL